MPPRPVEHEHDLLGRTGADDTREGGQLDLEELDADSRGQMNEGSPRGGMDEADQKAPAEAVLDGGNRALANGRHTRRSSGLRPMRCSSTAHSSTCACGKAVATALRRGRIFL
jgi:hypothetical protein